jgi:tetratricopeptide (TPR) repeat protein
MIFFVLILSLIGQNNTNNELTPATNSPVMTPQESFKNSLANASSIEELYRLDSLLLSKRNFKESELTENKLIEVIRKDNSYINSKLAYKYLSRGIKDLKKGRREKGERELTFAKEIDPSNKRIPLTMAKLRFPSLIGVAKNLWSYILTINFLNNKVFLIKVLILFLILFAFWILLATLNASIVFFISYLTKWIQGKINFSGLWIGALLFALFVWLPLQIFFLILVAMSLIKMNKPNLTRCATFLIILPLLISYSYTLSSNFNPRSSIYKEFKTRFNPYEYEIDSPVTPYGYLTKGIQQAKKGNLSEAEDLLGKGYNIRRDVTYLENLCSVYYAEGDTARSINMCENILSHYPKNEIANITIIKIHLNELNFDDATNQMKKSGIQLLEISRKEIPLYKYPPERWLYKYIFVPRGLFKHLAGKNLYVMILIGICIAIMSVFKKEKEKYCPICKSLMLIDNSQENMCISCITKLSLTKSKSIRERLKRRITAKALKVDKITNILMSLIIPGSAHFYKKRHPEGMTFSFFAAIFLLIFLNSVFFNVEESFQYRTSIGNCVFIISLIIFYSLLLYSSWRLEPYGNGR